MNQNPKCTVLILHNTPAGEEWAESDAGVMEEVNAVDRALSSLGVSHHSQGVRTLAEAYLALASSSENIVFNLVEGLAGSPVDANLVPALCKGAGKSATGCDTPTLLATLDKSQSKAILAAAGLPCPQGICVRPGDTPEIDVLSPGPWIVKPASSDAGEGIDADSVVTSRDRLQDAVRRVHERCRQPAIIEQFIGGREFNISLVEYRGELHVLPVAEIVFTLPEGKPPIVGYAAKWLTDSIEYQNTRRVVPADIEPALAEEISRITREAWRVLECRDYIRVDLRTDSTGRPYILEVNANPDISPDAGFAAALDAAGISYEGFVEEIVNNASRRFAGAEHVAARPQRKLPEGISIRRTVQQDRQPILQLLVDTKFFRPDELETAAEVLDDAIKHGEAGHYQSFTAVDEKEKSCGWICFGPTPCTIGTYDIYWMGVDPGNQGRGLGGALLSFAESRIAQQGGRLSIIETAGQTRYEPTRRFYLRNGYFLSARIPDFYSPGDDKLIYIKNLNA